MAHIALYDTESCASIREPTTNTPRVVQNLYFIKWQTASEMNSYLLLYIHWSVSADISALCTCKFVVSTYNERVVNRKFLFCTTEDIRTVIPIRSSTISTTNERHRWHYWGIKLTSQHWYHSHLRIHKYKKREYGWGFNLHFGPGNVEGSLYSLCVSCVSTF